MVPGGRNGVLLLTSFSGDPGLAKCGEKRGCPGHNVPRWRKKEAPMKLHFDALHTGLGFTLPGSGTLVGNAFPLFG